MTLLVIDVGNTNTVIGLFDGNKLLHNWRVRTVADHTMDEYGMLIVNLYKTGKVSSKSVNDIIISCVVPPMTEHTGTSLREIFSCQAAHRRTGDTVRECPSITITRRKWVQTGS